MPTIDYDELIRRVPIWMIAQNRDLVAEMPNIVQQAHEQLVGLIDHDLLKTRLPPIPVALDGLVDLTAVAPQVFEVRSLSIPYKDAGMVPLERRGLQYLQALYPKSKPGRPRYYAEDGETLLLRMFPPPPVVLQCDVEANQEPPVLSPTNQTNLFGEKTPRALEMATIYRAAYFMKEWDTAQQYQTEMIAAVTEANSQVVRRRRDETDTRPIDTANRQGS